MKVKREKEKGGTNINERGDFDLFPDFHNVVNTSAQKMDLREGEKRGDEKERGREKEIKRE